MSKKNCWELKNCGREIGGAKIAELGVCPAATDTSAHGQNSGINGGRICWLLSGTFCGGEVQGSFANKQSTCILCDIYKQIKAEEGSNFTIFGQGRAGL